MEREERAPAQSNTQLTRCSGIGDPSVPPCHPCEPTAISRSDAERNDASSAGRCPRQQDLRGVPRCPRRRPGPCPPGRRGAESVVSAKAMRPTRWPAGNSTAHTADHGAIWPACWTRAAWGDRLGTRLPVGWRPGLEQPGAARLAPAPATTAALDTCAAPGRALDCLSPRHTWSPGHGALPGLPQRALNQPGPRPPSF